MRKYLQFHCFENIAFINLKLILFLFVAAGFRSVSAVDTAAAQRARARAQYSNLARLKVTSGTASLRKLSFFNLHLANN